MIGPAINPLLRNPICEPLDVGLRCINSTLTVGRGQRIGLFAGTGVGKSVLLGMMTRFTKADVVVVGLIGERGREVKEFIEDILGEDDIKRAVVVASPADDAPLLRLRAAMYCTRIAEYFRDQNLNVLLLMDSLTRYAQAQREIAWPSVSHPQPRLSALGVCQAAGAGRVPAMQNREGALSLRFILCCLRGMTSKTRLLMQHGACLMGILYFHAPWPKKGITRRLISVLR